MFFPPLPLSLPLITEVKSQVGAAVILTEPDNIFHLTTEYFSDKCKMIFNQNEI